MYSIRKKLTLSIIVGMLVILTMTTVFLYYLIAREVQAVFDTALLDKAHAMISITELDAEDGLEFDFTDGIMPEFEAESNAQYYQVWERGVDLLVKSPSLGEENLPLFETKLGEHQFSDLGLVDGRPGRLVAITFLPRIEFEDEAELTQPATNLDIPTPPPLTLVLARERETLDHVLFIIGLLISTIMLLVAMVCGIMVRRMVGSGLSPLSSLAAQVGQIDESKLDQRLNREGEKSIEISPVEDQINHLLERLESAFEREKRFASNVAHELRTPLAELRTLSEVGKMVPGDRDQTLAFFNDVGDISKQMQTVVLNLLELARSDAGLLQSEPEDIVLGEYCDLIWQQSISGSAKSRVLVNNVARDLVINTDREKLGMILSNLFTNAVSYSPVDAKVRVEIEMRNNKVAIKVSNAAVDLKPEDIIHMKDRFWRKQKAHVAVGHSGLGLSLVEALARILDLKVNLQLDDESDFLVTITGLSTV
jgi:two-component system sensor histidine kinase QseC